MSRQTTRHLHLGCGESLSAVWVVNIRQLRRVEEEKLQDERTNQKVVRPRKAKGA